MNKALCTDLLFLLHPFIYDINRELENKKCLSTIGIDWAQLISKEEIEILENSIGEFILMNSFLPTSTHVKKNDKNQISVSSFCNY